MMEKNLIFFYFLFIFFRMRKKKGIKRLNIDEVIIFRIKIKRGAIGITA